VQFVRVRANCIEGCTVGGTCLTFPEDPAQPLHFALVLADVPQHRFDLRHHVEAEHLENFLLLVAEFAPLLRHVGQSRAVHARMDGHNCRMVYHDRLAAKLAQQYRAGSLNA
jgi:hypothetical protein